MLMVSDLIKDCVHSDFCEAFSASGSSCLWQTTAMVNVKSRAAQQQPRWTADQDQDQEVRACRLYISFGSLWSLSTADWVSRCLPIMKKLPWFAIFIAIMSSYASKSSSRQALQELCAGEAGSPEQVEEFTIASPAWSAGTGLLEPTPQPGLLDRRTQFDSPASKVSTVAKR